MWRFCGVLSQNLQVVSPFTYRGPLDPDLGTIVVSYPELFASLDLRNDRIMPHYGSYLANTLAFAGVFRNARDVKVQPEARGYIPLDDQLTLALRGFHRSALSAELREDTRPRRLFRQLGWSLPRRVGARSADPVHPRLLLRRQRLEPRLRVARDRPARYRPLLQPWTVGRRARRQLRSVEPRLRRRSVRSGRSGGAHSSREASVELRYPISGAFSGVVFTDTSDVSPATAPTFFFFFFAGTARI